MTEPTADEPDVTPDWAFSSDQDLRCPDCNALLAGLNWKHDTTGLVAQMDLVPCGHELSTDVWELTFSGRDRKFGTVIRTPKFIRKVD